MQPIAPMSIIPVNHLPRLKGEPGYYFYAIFADIPNGTGGLNSLEFRSKHR